MKTYKLQIREKGTKNRQTITMNANNKLQAFNLAWAFFEGFSKDANNLNNFETAFANMQPYMIEPQFLFRNFAGKYSVPFSGVTVVK